MPTARCDRISEDVRAVAADPNIGDRLAALGLVARGSTPAEFSAAIDEQRSRMTSIMRLIGSKAGR
jgi:tripartite-type tricarboxylate transporter receptor subunit TctC